MQVLQPYYWSPEFSKEIYNISKKFIENNDLSLFVYCRVYNNGECIYLSSTPGLQKFLFEHEIPVTAPIPTELQKQDKYWYLIEDGPYLKVMKDFKDIFNINAPIDYIVRSPGFYEMFCFASPYDYNTAVNRYFNRIEKMESFSNQFKDRARELISSAENAKLNLPQTMRSNILGLSEVKTKDTVEQGISRNFPLARSMKVGELAKVAGTTVRSLHYYDEIGLLRPSLIEDSGHRRYNQKDVERLQQIMSIKSLGLPLEDIAHCLSGEIHVSKKVFTMHEASISENISDLKEKKIRLRFLLDKLNHEQSLTSKELMTLITEAQKVELSS